MKDVIVVENIFNDSDVTADEFNSIVIEKIKRHSGWHLSNDEYVEKKDFGSLPPTFLVIHHTNVT
jgi:hypothetical protein